MGPSEIPPRGAWNRDTCARVVINVRWLDARPPRPASSDRPSKAQAVTDSILEWARNRRDASMLILKGLRSGLTATSEVRDHKRVDTTAESIAERRREILDLDALIVRYEGQQTMPNP